MKKQHFLILTLLLGFAIQAQTAGSLTFTFTNPMHTTGNYETNGRYALAVWIETQSGTFIKTKIRYWGTKTTDHLPTWKTKATGTGTSPNTTDAVTGSTSTNFAAKTVTWDGKNVDAVNNVNGTLVADGNYRVCIQECWGHSTATVTRYINFTKGPTADVQTPTADANFTNISLKWQPTLDAPSTENLPQFTVFPNPSKGIFTINAKNDIKTIRVFNINGAVVFNETITEESGVELNKTIDLSAVAPGAYIMELSNQYGTQTEKIIKE